MPFVETVILSMWGVVLRHSAGICDESTVPYWCVYLQSGGIVGILSAQQNLGKI